MNSGVISTRVETSKGGNLLVPIRNAFWALHCRNINPNVFIVMLEKTPGNFNVKKLSIILLFEANFNVKQ